VYSLLSSFFPSWFLFRGNNPAEDFSAEMYDGLSIASAELLSDDRTGAIVITPQFGWAYGFSEGLAGVEFDGK
jgi:hypothetical protein